MEDEFIHAIFCEQVRKEIKGGSTYIGVLKPIIVLEKPPPVRLRGLTAVVWIVTSHADSTKEVTLRLKVPGLEPIDRRIIPPPIKNISQAGKPVSDRRTGTIILDYGPLIIKQLGRISLEAVKDGVETLITRLNVRLEESGDEDKDNKITSSDKKSLTRSTKSRKKNIEKPI